MGERVRLSAEICEPKVFSDGTTKNSHAPYERSTEKFGSEHTEIVDRWKGHPAQHANRVYFTLKLLETVVQIIRRYLVIIDRRS